MRSWGGGGGWGCVCRLCGIGCCQTLPVLGLKIASTSETEGRIGTSVAIRIRIGTGHTEVHLGILESGRRASCAAIVVLYAPTITHARIIHQDLILLAFRGLSRSGVRGWGWSWSWSRSKGGVEAGLLLLIEDKARGAFGAAMVKHVERGQAGAFASCINL